jgi:hypothetical protein
LITKPPLPAAIAERSTAAAAGLAEDDVAAPGRGARRRIAPVRPDDQVGETVAVDVAGGRDARPLKSFAHWPLITKPPLPAAIAERSTALLPVWPKTT